MPVHITSRSDAEAIIREQVVSTIFQDAPKQSVFMSMARKLPNMTSDQTRIRVLVSSQLRTGWMVTLV